MFTSKRARSFRRHYGSSVGEYVRRLQVAYAERELAQTDRGLAEIGSSAGFYDQSHFTHTFRLYARMTPAQYRAAARPSNAGTKSS